MPALAATSVFFINYGILIRNYVKHVHNRPFRPLISDVERNLQILQRRRLLTYFGFIAAPAIILGLQVFSASHKDMLTIDVASNNSNNDTDNNLKTSGTFFALLIQFKNQLPNWFK